MADKYVTLAVKIVDIKGFETIKKAYKKQSVLNGVIIEQMRDGNIIADTEEGYDDVIVPYVSDES